MSSHDYEFPVDSKTAGQVTTLNFFGCLGNSLALVHLVPPVAVEGTSVELTGFTIQFLATEASIPFV